jgi:enoyl-CoA hydratase/carnithine racemase
LPAARALAAEMADGTSAVSVALARQMLWRMLGADHPMEAHKIDSRGVEQRGRSADAREGVESFLEKRPAHFPGRVSVDMPEFYPWWQERVFE